MKPPHIPDGPKPRMPLGKARERYLPKPAEGPSTPPPTVGVTLGDWHVDATLVDRKPDDRTKENPVV